jgi:hypothetical protein
MLKCAMIVLLNAKAPHSLGGLEFSQKKYQGVTTTVPFKVVVVVEWYVNVPAVEKV